MKPSTTAPTWLKASRQELILLDWASQQVYLRDSHLHTQFVCTDRSSIKLIRLEAVKTCEHQLLASGWSIAPYDYQVHRINILF